MKNILNKIPSLFKDEKGATMVEYAIMLALIAVVSLGVISQLGQSVSAIFSSVQSTLSTANG
jgi:pilus assembly protein Flp/PilA